MRNLMICTANSAASCDQIEKNDVSSAGSRYKGDKRCIHGCDGET
jgi:hypothetical protein